MKKLLVLLFVVVLMSMTSCIITSPMGSGYGYNSYGYDYTYRIPNYGYNVPNYGYGVPNYQHQQQQRCAPQTHNRSRRR